MSEESTNRVRALYDAYPYPNPVAGDGLISDTANMAAFLFAAQSFFRLEDTGRGVRNGASAAGIRETLSRGELLRYRRGR
jgi:hypothetical protein